MADTITIGRREFDVRGGHPYVMGILNVTPDSFSDGGLYSDTDSALRHVKQMLDDGADIVDVGGESTRPGYSRISVQEEIERTCFVIEAIKEHFNVPVSLDTYKYEVAEAGLLAGADLINDIWGFRWDGRMAALVAKHEVPCCLMHNRRSADYADFLTDVISDMQESVDIALAAGVKPERIITDPGIGFAKDTAQNLALLNSLERLVGLGYPVLLGTSRKSVIGNTLNLPVGEREEGTIATSVLGLQKGCTFFRVHDVRANVRALTMAQAILRS